MNLRIGTRGSELALFQADAVAAQLRAKTGLECDRVVIRTSGDTLADASLAQIGGKRLFVKEIEDALLEGEIDLAVHSSKDMPVVLPDGLRIAGVLPREEPRDAVVLPADGGQARTRNSTEQACGGRRSLHGCFRAPRFDRFAATSARACGSSMPASTTRSCSPPRD